MKVNCFQLFVIIGLITALCIQSAASESLLDQIQGIRETVVKNEISYADIDDSSKKSIIDEIESNNLVKAFFEGLKAENIHVDGLEPTISRSIVRKVGDETIKSANIYYKIDQDDSTIIIVRITARIKNDKVTIATLTYRNEEVKQMGKKTVSIPQTNIINDEEEAKIIGIIKQHDKINVLSDTLFDKEKYRIFVPNVANAPIIPVSFLPSRECIKPLYVQNPVLFERKKQDLCAECYCESDYKPVCGQDGISYANPCIAQCAQVEIKHNGLCKQKCGPYGAITVRYSLESNQVVTIDFAAAPKLSTDLIISCKGNVCNDIISKKMAAKRKVVKETVKDFEPIITKLKQKKLNNLVSQTTELLETLQKKFGINIECHKDSDCGFNTCSCSCTRNMRFLRDVANSDDIESSMACANICKEQYSCSCVENKCVNKQSLCICPEIYAPVCGDDGKTYSNECSANCAGVKIKYKGKCKADLCIADLGEVEKVSKLDKLLTKHIISCKKVSGKIANEHSVLQEYNNFKATVITKFFEVPLYDYALNENKAAPQAQAILHTCKSLIKINPIFEKIKVEEVLDKLDINVDDINVESLKMDTSALMLPSYMDVPVKAYVTSVSCETEYINQAYINPTYCESNNECVRQSSCCDCGKPKYVNKYNVQDIFCQYMCDCMPIPGTFKGACVKNTCTALQIDNELYCESSADCVPEDTCCGSGRCINREFQRNPICDNVFCAHHIDEEKYSQCTCENNRCVRSTGQCRSDFDCQHLKCANPQCNNGKCVCGGFSNCGDGVCSSDEDGITCAKDCEATLKVEIKPKQVQIYNSVEISAQFSTINKQTLHDGFCYAQVHMDLPVPMPMEPYDSADGVEPMAGIAQSEMASSGMEITDEMIAPYPMPYDKIKLYFDVQRKRFIGHYHTTFIGHHAVNVVCEFNNIYKSAYASFTVKEKEKTYCEKKGGYCISFEEECKIGYHKTGADGCEFDGAQCCTPKQKECNKHLGPGYCEESGGRFISCLVQMRTEKVIDADVASSSVSAYNVIAQDVCGVCVCTSENRCIETDDGDDAFTKGAIWPGFSDYAKTDVCDGKGKNLYEYRCDDDGNYAGDHMIPCKHGCLNGACLKEPLKCSEHLDKYQCEAAGGDFVVETDCPENPLMGAPCSLITKCICEEEVECIIDADCESYYSNCNCGYVCGPKRDILWADCMRACPMLDCMEGMDCIVEKPNCACQQGKCSETVASCKDSDAISAIAPQYVKGTTSKGNDVHTDTCTYCTGACEMGGDCTNTCGAVVEYYCSGNYIQKDVIHCKYGCVNGACLDKPNLVTEVVTCRFDYTKKGQECYSEYGSCKTVEGSNECKVEISGTKGEKVTWKSSCGGYGYTIIDGENEKARFYCGDCKSDLDKDACETAGGIFKSCPRPSYCTGQMACPDVCGEPICQCEGEMALSFAVNKKSFTQGEKLIATVYNKGTQTVSLLTNLRINSHILGDVKTHLTSLGCGQFLCPTNGCLIDVACPAITSTYDLKPGESREFSWNQIEYNYIWRNSDGSDVCCYESLNAKPGQYTAEVCYRDTSGKRECLSEIITIETGKDCVGLSADACEAQSDCTAIWSSNCGIDDVVVSTEVGVASTSVSSGSSEGSTGSDSSGIACTMEAIYQGCKPKVCSSTLSQKDCEAAGGTALCTMAACQIGAICDSTCTCQCPPEKSISLVTSKKSYLPGEKIEVKAINNGNAEVDLDMYLSVFLNEGGQWHDLTTYVPCGYLKCPASACTAKIICPAGEMIMPPLRPGESRPFTWNQLYYTYSNVNGCSIDCFNEFKASTGQYKLQLCYYPLYAYEYDSSKVEIDTEANIIAPNNCVSTIITIEKKSEFECSTDADCVTGGCSGQLCGPKSLFNGLTSTCEWKEEYGCYRPHITSCICNEGFCGWKQTDDLETCLIEAESGDINGGKSV